ncbi:MAG: 2-hydroxyacyl-CoA dehydratase [Dehalococcoidia bacterium]
MPSALDRFHQVVVGRHQYAEEWKARTGGKVMGYLCTYVPEELAYAAGVLPVRIMGSHQPQSITENYIFSMWCPYCRDCLAQGLLGRYDYLEGIVFAQTCQHIRQTFDSWVTHLPMEFSYDLYMPSSLHVPLARECLAGELQSFQEALEGWTGHPIAPSDIEGAVDIYNTNRRLMTQVYELRRGLTPPITGVQAMEMVLSSMFMDKQEQNGLLRQALEELKGQPGRNSGVRLMLLGSENDDTDLVGFVESMGAQIVVDDHCTGTRYFWGEVPPGDDLLTAIAQRYVDRPPCPLKDLAERRRVQHVLTLARDYQVQGAVMVLEKFCDPHEFDLPSIQGALKEADIPMLVLEVDATIPAGQFRTRIEAFLEMIEVGV